MKNGQEQFIEWLSKQVSPSKLSDYGLVLVELETFAKSKKIISGSLSDVSDPVTTGKIVNALTMDRFYRFMHKKSIRRITELAQYLNRYAKEKAAAYNSVSVPAATIPCLPQQAAVDTAVADAPAAAPPSAAKAAKAEVAAAEAEGVAEEEATGAAQTVNFSKPVGYTFTKPVSAAYFGDVYPSSSWRDLYVKVCQILLEDYPQVFEGIRCSDTASRHNCLVYDESTSRKLLSPIEIAAGYYVETNRSAGDLIRNIKKLLDLCNVDYENLVITYIKKDALATQPVMPNTVTAKATSAVTESDNIVSGERGDGEENAKPAPRYKLETTSAQYYGTIPAEAFARFCEHVAHAHPLAFRSLLDAKYNEDGSVVLSRTDITGNSVLMRDPVAYIRRDFTELALVIYGKWICSVCGEADVPLRITELPHIPEPTEAEESQPAEDSQPEPPAVAANRLAATQPVNAAVKAVPGSKSTANNDAARVEKIVLPTDLAGMTTEVLSLELRASIVATRRAVAASPRLVQLGEKIVHQDAFVDWEDGADQLEKILDKLLARNDGYVSAAQLYDFAHAEMQMFLNDNDMDDARLVYDLARHLFEKIGYHNKHLVFQSNAHISRSDMAVSTAEDLIRSYALAQGGIFEEAALVQYLQSVGVKTGNLRGRIKLYTQPNYLMYDNGRLILGECLNIDAGWFTDVRSALQRLFADMGDHVVMRDIQPWWFSLLPALPAGLPWTLLLLQNVLFHYRKRLGGAHTISAMPSQSIDTIHAMLVSGDSEVQSFTDAVVAFLVDEGIEQREFEAEELRQRLVQRGMVAGNELIWNMPKALANDERFIWAADGQRVVIKV